MAIQYTVIDNVDEQCFQIQLGKDLAFLAYRVRDDKIVLVHTEVPEAFEGQGIGSALVRSALEHAKAEGLSVVPLCPFVQSYIKRHLEYSSLVR